jgi:hypothetical protein
MVMAVYTQIGSVTVEAFQWTGQAFSTLPVFANRKFLQASGGVLDLPTVFGTVAIPMNYWAVLHSDGSVVVMTNAAFKALYQ